MIEFLIERGHSWSEVRSYPLPLVMLFFWAGVRMEEMKSNKNLVEGALSSRGVLPSSVMEERDSSKLARGKPRSEVDRLKSDMKNFRGGRRR